MDIKQCECGNQPRVLEDWYDFPKLYSVKCSNCKKQTSWQSDKNYVITEWNKKSKAIVKLPDWKWNYE